MTTDPGGSTALDRGGSPIYPAVAIFLAIALAGCSKRTEVLGPPSTTHDSVGVTIVESSRPAWPADSGWSLDSTPALVIPATVSPDTTRFLRARSAFRLSDGRIVVGSEGTSQLVFFDPNGRFLRAVGNRGSRPDEFFQILSVMPLPNDSLLVDNAIDLRIHDAQGRYRRTIPEGDKTLTVKFGVLANLTLVGSDWPQGTESQARRWVGMAKIYHQTLSTGASRRVAVVPAVQFAKGSEESGEPVVFSPELSFAVGDSVYCLAFPRDFEINCLSTEGSIKRIIRRETTQPVTPETAIAQYRQAYARYLLGSDVAAELRAKRQARLDATTFADNLPAFDLMRFDRTGHLWVREFSVSDDIERGRGSWNGAVGIPVRSAPSRWSIFDPEGRWLGDLTLPASFTPLDIGSDYLMGLARTGDGAESIVVYRLRRGGRS